MTRRQILRDAVVAFPAMAESQDFVMLAEAPEPRPFAILCRWGDCFKAVREVLGNPHDLGPMPRFWGRQFCSSAKVRGIGPFSGERHEMAVVYLSWTEVAP